MQPHCKNATADCACIVRYDIPTTNVIGHAADLYYIGKYSMDETRSVNLLTLVTIGQLMSLKKCWDITDVTGIENLYCTQCKVRVAESGTGDKKRCAQCELTDQVKVVQDKQQPKRVMVNMGDLYRATYDGTPLP